jgi:peroxiredoxin
MAVHAASQTNDVLLGKQIDELNQANRKKQDSVSKLITDCNMAIGKSTDSISKAALNKRLTYLWSIKDAGLREEVRTDLDFAMKHPSSAFCLELVMRSMQRQEGMQFYDKYLEVYQNFSSEIKASPNGILMAQKLKYFKQSDIGSIAPDFSVKDINGQTLTLSDFREKKYVLLDFWASWCAPCIEDQAYLKKIYKKFNKNDFEIISISRDDDMEKWVKSIEKHKTGVWKQVCIVSDLNNCNNPSVIIPVGKIEMKDTKNTFAVYNLMEKQKSVDVNYYVSGIPHYILIDKTGVIIGKWKGSGELNMNELEEKLDKVFKN